MKTREITTTHKIALLATGDEISNGDILNTNSREIAKRLGDAQMQIGLHAVAPDQIADIEKSITYLLQSHQALIMTGGLGPTSDDLTRYALSQALNKPLIFDETSWQAIVTLLNRYGYTVLPESNRQQALFPEGATIIPNPNGTAAGCMIEHNHQWIFMLPGPPAECLPMIDSIVIPKLKEKHFQQTYFHKNWTLFGVSEGQIAEQLDAISKSYECVTGYRIFYPYLEFKIQVNHEHQFTELLPQIEKIIAPYLFSEGCHTASEQLRETLLKLDYPIQVIDHATGGLLETTIKTPETLPKLQFTHKKTSDIPCFFITGLNEFWQGKKDCTQTQIELNIHHKDKQTAISAEIPLRGERVKRYAVEWVCWQVHNHLTCDFSHLSS